VDDLDEFREMIAEELVEQGHTVREAANGKLAAKLMQSETFDLILLDWDLPDAQGVDLCKNFRMAGGTTPVLMLTGKDQIEDKKHGFDAGVDDYLIKPFHPVEFSSRVEALLRRAGYNKAAQNSGHSVSHKFATHSNALEGTELAGRYQLISVCGEGNMAVVYKARHKLLDKIVAVKILRPHIVNPKSLQRFRQEARAISSLSHPNLVNVSDFDVSASGLCFIVMDYFEGMSLNKLIDERAPLSAKEVVPILLQVCYALLAAHEKGIIHRDIKPSNIMLIDSAGAKDVVKLVDFGIVKLVEDEGGHDLTKTGEICGSPAYMSPEQSKGQALDVRTDIFSLGCVMYELLTGVPPWLGESTIETIYLRLVNPPAPFADICPIVDHDPHLEAITMRALAGNPGERYQCVADLRDDLLTV